MAAPKKKNINLLVQEGFEHTPLGKALNWLLSAGRVIVVLTQLVVIAAFLSRFWLDRQLTDLNEENTLRKVQIEALGSFESNFRQTQKRLAVYKELDTVKTDAGGIVKEVASLLPAGVSLSSISVSDEKLILDGIALSEQGLAGFIKALEGTAQFQSPTLTEVSLETTGQQVIKFSIRAVLTGNEERNQDGNKS